MNRAQLVARVAQRHGWRTSDTARIVDATFTVITEALRLGDTVQLTGFGSFRRRYRPARRVRHPRTGDVRTTTGGYVPVFVPGERLRRAVRSGGATAVRSEASASERDAARVIRGEHVADRSSPDRRSRKVSLHLYLPESVVVGELYVAGESLLEFLSVSGTFLYVNEGVAFPYAEGIPPIRAREVAVRKADVLFAVARGEMPPEPNPEESTEVQVTTGPFVVRGKTAYAWAPLLRELSEPRGAFVPLWQVSVYGRSRASFSEPALLLAVDRISALGTA